MDDAKRAEVARLLAEGLDHYGEDAIGKALQTWRLVLDIDPHNAEALDYLQTADRRDQRRLPLEEQMSDTARRIVREVGELIGKGDWKGALDLLRCVSLVRGLDVLAATPLLATAGAHAARRTRVDQPILRGCAGFRAGFDRRYGEPRFGTGC